VERSGTADEVANCRDSIGALATPPATSGRAVLLIEADPFGEVYVDGVQQGEAPRECVVGEGPHRVSVVNPTLGTREAVVRLTPGERARWLGRFGGPP